MGPKGNERTFCILDLVVHGGRHYSMGFLRDMSRMNVGLSRAKNGLMVVGYKDMTTHQWVNKGVKAR